jgi:ABC-type multidrug transport system fused ATPase/permease subunit
MYRETAHLFRALASSYTLKHSDMMLALCSFHNANNQHLVYQNRRTVKSYPANRGNAIIKNINISIHPGEFTVIMGNSGAVNPLCFTC